MTFFDTLERADPANLTLCVGIDPTPKTLAAWGLDDTAEGALRFGITMVEAAAGAALVVKPQVAYFERFGADGFRVLADVIQEARRAGLLVLADPKRGDIASTMEAYAMAWVGPRAPLRSDAVTATPYLGLLSLEPLLERARDCGAYVMVVTRSSNPEGRAIQDHGTPKVWHGVLNAIAEWEENRGNRTVGAVVGATAPEDLGHALRRLPRAYFLAPGIGNQGASYRDVMSLTDDRKRIVASSSRALAATGPRVADIKMALRTG